MRTLAKIRADIDYLPWIVNLLLVIFLDGLFGGFYRFTKGTWSGIVIGVLWLALSYVPILVFGAMGTIPFGILTIIDIISVAFFGKIKILA